MNFVFDENPRNRLNPGCLTILTPVFCASAVEFRIWFAAFFTATEFVSMILLATTVFTPPKPRAGSPLAANRFWIYNYGR